MIAFINSLKLVLRERVKKVQKIEQEINNNRQQGKKKVERIQTTKEKNAYIKKNRKKRLN